MKEFSAIVIVLIACLSGTLAGHHTLSANHKVPLRIKGTLIQAASHRTQAALHDVDCYDGDTARTTLTCLFGPEWAEDRWTSEQISTAKKKLKTGLSVHPTKEAKAQNSVAKTAYISQAKADLDCYKEGMPTKQCLFGESPGNWYPQEESIAKFDSLSPEERSLLLLVERAKMEMWKATVDADDTAVQTQVTPPAKSIMVAPSKAEHSQLTEAMRNDMNCYDSTVDDAAAARCLFGATLRAWKPQADIIFAKHDDLSEDQLVLLKHVQHAKMKMWKMAMETDE